MDIKQPKISGKWYSKYYLFLQVENKEIKDVHLIALSGYDDQGCKDLCQ
jgi:hypothetical protein